MIPFAAMGIIIGSLTFSYFSEELLKFIIGLMGFIFAGHYFFFKKNKEAKSQKNFFKGGICSTIAGFTSFCVHAGGTPTSIYMLPLENEKRNICWNKNNFFYFCKSN